MFEKKWKVRGQDRENVSYSSPDGKFTGNSSAWSFDLDNLLESNLPNALLSLNWMIFSLLRYGLLLGMSKPVV